MRNVRLFWLLSLVLLALPATLLWHISPTIYIHRDTVILICEYIFILAMVLNLFNYFRGRMLIISAVGICIFASLITSMDDRFDWIGFVLWIILMMLCWKADDETPDRKSSA